MTETVLPTSATPRVAMTHGQIMAVIWGLMIGLFLAALDQTIVATALPTMVGELGGLEQLSWVVTAYLLASTVTAPLYGKISDLYGRKIVFQAAIVLFLAGSILCGLSQNMGQLIAWLAAVVALVGVALVSGAPTFGRLDPLGLLAAGIAAISFATYIILSGFLGRSLPTITIAAYGFSFSALFLLAAFRVVLPPATPRVLIELVWLVLLGTVAPFLLEVAALRMTDPGIVGVVATLEPVVAATAAWWWLDQYLAPLQVAGGLLVVGAVALIQRYSSRPPLGI
jgi:MFS family permease